MNTITIVRLFALAAIWGSSFIFIRLIVPFLGPIATADFRLLIAGIALSVYFWMIKFDAKWKQNWRHYLVVGAMNSAIPFTLYSFAALTIPASYSVILNSSTPLFATLFSALWLDDRLTPRKVFGILLGVSGVTLVSGAGPVQLSGPVVLACGACLLASSFYGISGVYIKRVTLTVTPMGLAGGSQLMAGTLLAPALLAFPPPGPVSGITIVYLLALALLSSGIAYLLFYRLIADIGPTRALTVTFLMPAFGMVWGYIFLGETISIQMVAGCLLILAGTAAVVLSPSASSSSPE